ncbi:hypothetical protein ABE096_06260 [Robertmurraya massiliosenegalensis]|uniref:hypothetical protein n=1 Tax=Robertmurraya TaxID=2837507 RepID=UPI0039A685BC
MKKKLMVGLLAGGFILGAGTIALAQTDEDGVFNFEQMQPQIEKMHPDLTKEEQKEMFDACHGDGGMMEQMQHSDGNHSHNMMNNF